MRNFIKPQQKSTAFMKMMLAESRFYGHFVYVFKIRNVGTIIINHPSSVLGLHYCVELILKGFTHLAYFQQYSICLILIQQVGYNVPITISKVQFGFLIKQSTCHYYIARMSVFC